MSKLSKSIGELVEASNAWSKEIEQNQNDIGMLQEQVATLQKQMSCNCSRFEVVFSLGFLAIGGDGAPQYKRKCLSCGLEIAYASKEAAMKDRDALLKVEIDRLTAERKSLKDK
jgi:hypothetical protein